MSACLPGTGELTVVRKDRGWAVTLAEDILHLLRLRPEGMSDSELTQTTGKLHQQINQRCRALAAQGVLVRESVDGVIRNRLAAAAEIRRTPAPVPATSGDGRDWFWEGNIQSALCT